MGGALSLDGVTVRTLTGIPKKKGLVDGDPSKGRFQFPSAVIFDAIGNLIVADEQNHCIRHVKLDGSITTLAGCGKAGYADGRGLKALFNSPEALCLDAIGRVLVCDRANHRIRMVTENGKVTTVAGAGDKGFADGPVATAKFNSPAGIATDAKGNIYVADTGTPAGTRARGLRRQCAALSLPG
jgi:hypothetical protein